MSFEQAVEFVLKQEGGYVYDHRDNGGETNFGISKKAYPNLNIKELTVEQAKEIYKRDYWDKLPVLPDRLAFHVFSCAVNCGINRAIRILQGAIGATVDGVWGYESSTKIQRMDEKEAVKRFCSSWIMYYARLDDFPIFGKGWVNRVIEGLL